MELGKYYRTHSQWKYQENNWNIYEMKTYEDKMERIIFPIQYLRVDILY